MVYVYSVSPEQEEVTQLYNQLHHARQIIWLMVKAKGAPIDVHDNVARKVNWSTATIQSEYDAESGTTRYKAEGG